MRPPIRPARTTSTRRLIDAIERRDTAGACRLMEEHLEHIERSLRLDGRPELEIDLAEALLG